MSTRTGSPLRHRRQRGPRACAALVGLWLGLGAPAGAPAQAAPAAPAAVDPGTAVERARSLVRLATLAQMEQPARAVAQGTEALRLLPADRATTPTRVAAHAALATAYAALGRYDSASAHVEAGRGVAERAGDRAGIASMLTRLGTLEQRRGDPGRAVAHLADAL